MCNKKVEDYNKIINNKRNDFEIMWTKLSEINTLSEEPNRKHKNNTENLKTHFRQLFFEIIDNISMQLKDRFGDLKNLLFLELLNSNFFFNYQTQFPEKALTSLKENYSKFFDFAKLRSELIVVYNDKDFSNQSVWQISRYIIDNNLSSCFSQLYKLCVLFLTISPTSVSAERSFSALRRIKTYLRSTLSDEKLYWISILAIEKQFLKQQKQQPFFYQKVIEQFKTKNRRIELNYK